MYRAGSNDIIVKMQSSSLFLDIKQMKLVHSYDEEEPFDGNHVHAPLF